MITEGVVATVVVTATGVVAAATEEVERVVDPYDNVIATELPHRPFQSMDGRE